VDKREAKDFPKLFKGKFILRVVIKLLIYPKSSFWLRILRNVFEGTYESFK